MQQPGSTLAGYSTEDPPALSQLGPGIAIGTAPAAHNADTEGLQAEMFAVAIENVLFSAGKAFPAHPGAMLNLADALNGRTILEAALAGAMAEEIPMAPGAEGAGEEEDDHAPSL